MNVLTTDFHTHILPGVDDGSPSIEDSVKMLKQERQQGIMTVCLTPHFNAQLMYPKEFVANRNKAMQELCQALTDEKDLPKMILGAEVQFCTGMSQWEQLKQLSLGDTGYILIEMPHFIWTESVFQELERIYKEQGLIPIIAHFERYINPFTVKKTLRRLSDLPVLLQCNCNFFTEKRTRRAAFKLLKKQKIHLFGTDCHSIAWRPILMEKTRSLLLSHADPQAIALLTKIEEAVLKCEHLIIDNSEIH